MTNRQEVFQSKVLQRLFPVAPKVEKEPCPPRIMGALANKTFVKRKKTQEDTAAGDAGQTKSAAVPHRRVYTVLPPPADYKTHPEKSLTLPQLERINSAKDPAEESVHESNEDADQVEEQEEHKRKRKRRKRKPGPPHQDSGQDDAAPGQSQTVAGGGEHISRNKKRKLKKKRHKEKLLSKGEMPRAAALVFTYQKDGGEEEEEEGEGDNERRAAEVSDFFRTTLEIYLSDPKLHVSPHLSGTVENLLSHISSGCEPNSVLKQLYSLKTSVQHKETTKLEQALQELHNSSSVTAEEHAAVASLFQYWITDILPLRGDKTPGLSATHP